MSVSSVRSNAQSDSLLIETIKDYASWIEYCHIDKRINHKACNPFNWAKMEGEEFHYSGRVLGFDNYRRFRKGSWNEKKGDYYDFASGRLIMLRLQRPSLSEVKVGTRIQIAVEDIYTINGDIESNMVLTIVVPESASKAQIKELSSNYVKTD